MTTLYYSGYFYLPAAPAAGVSQLLGPDKPPAPDVLTFSTASLTTGQTVQWDTGEFGTVQATYTGYVVQGQYGPILEYAGNYYVLSQFQQIPVGDSYSVTPVAESPYYACYLQGTRILTARGEIPVERLRVGDLVPTWRGQGLAPIVWIGRSRLDAARHPRPCEVNPVRIRKDAFGDGRPHRDLMLSPDHAIYAPDQGVLIPVRHLINDTTISQEAARDITYWHVELAAHDVILAEGLLTESYLDTGNRAAFGDMREPAHPGFGRTAAQAWDHHACAPLIEDGAPLDAVRERLAAQAERLGFAAPSALRIAIDTAGAVALTLPADIERIELMSASGHIGRDVRRLGALLSGLALDGQKIPLDDPMLARGFHAPEQHEETTVRWTDGCAILRPGRGSRDRRLDIAIAAVAGEAALRHAA